MIKIFFFLNIKKGRPSMLVIDNEGVVNKKREL